MNYFAELGGFDSFVELLRKGCERPAEEPSKNKNDSAKEPEKELLPLEYFGPLFSAFYNSGALLSE
jgi:hypothetical protein